MSHFQVRLWAKSLPTQILFRFKITRTNLQFVLFVFFNYNFSIFFNTFGKKTELKNTNETPLMSEVTVNTLKLGICFKKAAQ
jgi:hypothetical protein